MYVVCVTVTVKPSCGDAFVVATQKNHLGTRQEVGNLRFDVLRQAAAPAADEPETFLLYEVYRSEADFAAHQQTEHYQTWRVEVEPLMHEPRRGLRFRSVFPEPWQ